MSFGNQAKQQLNCQIVDCPGYGFAVASDVQKEQWRKFMEIYLQKANNLHRVIILVDSVTGLMDSDKFLMQMLTDAHRPFQIVLTKADKLREGQVTNKMKELGDSVKGMGTICSPILHAVCAKDGYGLQELMANIIYVLAMPILRKLKIYSFVCLSIKEFNNLMVQILYKTCMMKQ